MITVKPVTHNAFTPLRNGDNYGWAHACGFFVYSPAEPISCTECRSAFRYGSAAKLNVKDPQLPQSPHWLSDGFWVGFRVIAPAKEPTDLEKTKFWDADDELTRRVLERDREIREIPPQAK